MAKDNFYIACRQILNEKNKINKGITFVLSEYNRFETKQEIDENDNWHATLLHKKYHEAHAMLRNISKKDILKHLIHPYKLNAGIYELWIHRLRVDSYPSFNRGLQRFIKITKQEVQK